MFAIVLFDAADRGEESTAGLESRGTHEYELHGWHRVMPAYNCAGYTHALQSLAQQTVRPERVVVVDDGSTDDTAAEIAKFRTSSDLPVQYIRQTNQGIASARNNGVELCDTAYIAFLESDDAFYPAF